MSRIDIGRDIMKPKVVPATAKGFQKAAGDSETGRICAELADLLEQVRRGELSEADYKELKAQKKKGCWFYTPHAHFQKGYKRNDGEPMDSGKAIIDLDGCEHFRELYAQRLAGREQTLGINMVNISVSATGGHVLFDIPEGLDREQAQAWMAHEMGDVAYDKAVHEKERAIYIPCLEYILYQDEDLMFSDDLHGAKGIRYVEDNHPEHAAGDSPDKACSDEMTSKTYPTDYHGIPFEQILTQYWKVNNRGFEPTEGDRDTLTFQLASDLRHICGRSFAWLDQVIPCYDGFPLEEKRQKIRNALQSKYEGMPTRL